MLQPKRTKFRKAHKGRIHGQAKGGFTLTFGSYGLKAVEPERITARQIEATRRAITRHMKRAGSRLDPGVPGCAVSPRSRPKSGWVKVRAHVEYWVAKVKPGRIMFEIDGVPDDVAREALRLGAAKLPIKTKVVTRPGE
jgi:large subunit ribosomal protein L16